MSGIVQTLIFSSYLLLKGIACCEAGAQGAAAEKGTGTLT